MHMRQAAGPGLLLHRWSFAKLPLALLVISKPAVLRAALFQNVCQTIVPTVILTEGLQSALMNSMLIESVQILRFKYRCVILNYALRRP